MLVVIGAAVPIGMRIGWVRANLTCCGAFFTVALGPAADLCASVIQILEHFVLVEVVAHVVVQALLAGWDHASGVLCSLAYRRKAVAMDSDPILVRST